jgi:hypothetical protein
MLKRKRYTALSNPQEYHNAQVPSAIPYPTMTPGTTALVLQLGNVLLLLAALAILCCWTPHPEIARRYLLIVAVADIGHIYSCYAAMGSTQVWDFANYNEMGAYASNPMAQSWISGIAFRFFCVFVRLSPFGTFSMFRFSWSPGFESTSWIIPLMDRVAWGNIGGSAFLCVNRIATVLGLFGEIRNQVPGKGGKRA